MLKIVNDEEGVMELGTAFTIVSQKKKGPKDSIALI